MHFRDSLRLLCATLGTISIVTQRAQSTTQSNTKDNILQSYNSFIHSFTTSSEGVVPSDFSL